MSFAIIISEKGGQERREVFDKNEISIGRVQGNDLLLPKGNVSKRHARIVFRDGRFIVTDLKSTNGSYVNGHRIAQATIVREGDKIYIGDFVLKVDAGGTSSSSPMSPGGRDERRTQDVDGTHNEEDRSLGTPPPRIAGVDGSAVSHIPLEQDPDEASGQSHQQVGPSRGGAQGVVGDTRPPRVAASAGPTAAPLRSSTVGAPPPARPSAAAPPPLPASPSVPAPPPLAPAAPPIVHAPAAPKIVAKPKARAGHASALRALLERLADVVDLDEGDVFAPPNETKRASVEKVLREQARALQQQSELPAAVTSEELVREALDEALHVGPLGALLDDDGVRAIHVHRHDAITAVRDDGPVALEIGFTSEIALRRALGRLARASGVTLRDGEVELAFRLGARGMLRALLPPAASSGTILSIRRPLGASATIDDAVRGGVFSRPMATLLQLAMNARSNILIVGPSGASPLAFAQTLLSATAAEDRVLAVDDAAAIVGSVGNAATLHAGNDVATARRAIDAALGTRPDRTVVDPLFGANAVGVIDAIGGGLEGVVAIAHATAARQAIHRVAASITAVDGAADAHAARALVEAAFDFVVEIGRGRSGKQRVLRLSELASDGNERKLRDVFEFVVDASQPERGDGAFQPTGIVPALVVEQRALGVRIDDSGFRRGAAVRVP